MVLQPFPRSTPEEQGIASTSITSFLGAIAEQRLELHSFMLVRNGHVVSEGWWDPYGPDMPHILYSLTKTFMATAIGLAAQEGLLSLEDTAASYFPERLPEQPSERLLRIRVKDLLMMGTGQTGDTIPQGAEDWIAAFFAKPVEAEPGTKFAYHSGASNMLAAILERASGETLDRFLQTRLFGPLGIEGEQWDLLPDGSVPGGYGLRLKTEDIAKLGQLYLQKGIWNGERLLTEQWVSEAIGKQIDNGPNPNPDWASGYGYQIWRCARDNAYRFIGMFNQLCLVLPEHNALVVTTSGLTDEAAVLDAIWEHLVPAMQERAVDRDVEAGRQLAETIGRLGLMPEIESLRVSPGKIMDPGSYKLGENPFGWETFSVESEENRLTLTVQLAGKERQTVSVRPEGWIYGEFEREPIASVGGWKEDGSLYIHTYFVSTPYCRITTFEFEEDRVTLHLTGNVGMPEPVVIQGKRLEGVPATGDAGRD